ncbi:hypothetical protein MASR1M68_00010 [Elusimicrobiota bacterium]
MGAFIIFIFVVIIVLTVAVFLYIVQLCFLTIFGKKDCSVCSPDSDCPLDRCDLEDPCDESCEGCKNYDSEKQ